MNAFSYHAPHALDEAVGLLSRHGREAQPIAGGQSLLLAMKDRLARPAVLVSLAGIPDLQGWRYTDAGALELGAGTTYAALAAGSFRGWHSEIAAVAANLADRPVRNRGTVGGALCQADPRFDMPPLMVGANASVRLISSGGERQLPAAELFPAVGGTTRHPGEILVTILVPPVADRSGLAFEKFRYRLFDAALASISCALRLDADDRVAEARVVVGAVAPSPVVLERAGQLVGVQLAESDVEEFSRLAMTDAVPEQTTRLQRYQRELVAVLVRQAMTRALEQARS